jgi:uncharacterized protein (TIGR03437 family)
MKRWTAFLLATAAVSLRGQSTPPQPIIQIMNAASHAPGMPGGGALATVLVTLPSADYLPGGLQPGLYLPDPPTPFPPSLQGWSVLVNGAVAPIQRVQVFGFDQPVVWINIQVPLERNATLGSLNIGGAGGGPIPPGTAIADYNASYIASASMADIPGTGGFFKDANGYINAWHASDGSWVTPDNPAHAGEQIIALADDFFSVWPPPPIGVPVAEQQTYFPGVLTGEAVKPYQALYLQKYVQSCTSTAPPGLPACGGDYTTTPAVPIDQETLAPGMIGVEEIIFHIPANQQPGDWALFFNDGSCPDGRGSPCSGQSYSVSSPYALVPVR